MASIPIALLKPGPRLLQALLAVSSITAPLHPAAPPPLPTPPQPHPGAVLLPAAVGKVFLKGGNLKPYDGMVYLEIFLDESRPAAPRPLELTVIPVPAVKGVVSIPIFPERWTVRRAFVPGRSTPGVDLPVPRIPGGVLGGDLVLEERREVKVFRALVVDGRSGLAVPRVRFLFDDRDHRTLKEQVTQRPEKRPGVSMHTTTDAGEVFLSTDDDPFPGARPINISLIHPEYATATVPARSFLREAVRDPEAPPVVLKMERGAVIAGRIGPRHTTQGVEGSQVRLRKLGAGREEVPVFLDPAGNFRTVVPAGRYELSLDRGLERIEAVSGAVVRVDRD